MTGPADADLRAIFDSSAIGIAQTDIPGRRFVRVNRAMCTITGFEAHELLGMRVDDLNHPDDRAADEALFQRSLADRSREYRTVKRYRRRDGQVVWVSVTGHVLLDARGVPQGAIAIVQDITAQRESQERQRESDARLRLATDAASIGIWEWNVRTNVIRWDAQMFRIYDIPPTEDQQIVYATWRHAVLPEDLPEQERILKETLESAGQSARSFRIRTPGGDVRYVEAVETVRRNVDGEVEWVIGTNIDVTERRLHQRNLALLADLQGDFAPALSEAEILEAACSRVRAHLQVARCLFVQIDEAADLATVIHDCHPPDTAGLEGRYRISEFHSAAERETLRQGRSILVHDVRDRAADAAARFGVLGVGSLLNASYQSHGRWCFVLSAMRPEPSHWHDEDRVALEEVAARIYLRMERARSEAEREAAEAALREADRRKDEFLATLAHELRNPLAPLRTALDIVQLAPAAETREQATRVMERQLTQMVRLVDDLLDVSRITRGHIDLRRAPVELALVITSAVETARPVLERMEHTLTVELPAPPLVVHADLTRLAQVFANLLTNAAKYTERGGRIAVRACREADEVTVAVTDSGIGIPADQLTRIFEMFSQVDRSLEKSQGGLGIGLHIVRRLVEMHGGTVRAVSGGTGQGATFEVVLPLVAAPAPSHEEPAAAPKPATRPARVLIVDDNADAADTLAMTLEMFGHTVRTCYDGPTGLEIARTMTPDLVLLDIGMPGMSGYEVCRRLRAEPWGRDMRIVALTGWGAADDRRRTREAGFDQHLVKPVDPDALVRLVADLRGTPASRGE